MGYMVCRAEKETRILLDEISLLLIENPQVCLTSALLSELMNHKIRVVVCDTAHNPQGELEPYCSCSDAPEKLLRQLNWPQAIRDETWKSIVYQKIDNQIDCMKRHKASSERLNMLNAYLKDLQPGDPNNREGQAARIYFTTLFGEDFDRRSEFDIRNAYLNYGYSLLLSLVNREISSYGYCNLLGIHHKGAKNPFNLGCDIVEPLRPLLDDFVLSADLKTETFKKQILCFLTSECLCGGKKMIIQNAINSYVLSVFGALKSEDASKITKIGFING